MIASTRSGDHEGVLSALFAAAQLATGVLAAEEVARRWHDESKVPGFSVGGLAAHLYAGIRRLEIGLNEVVPEDATTVGLVDQPIPPAAAEVVIGVCVELARARYGDLGVVRAFTRVERAGPDRIRVL